MAITKLVSPSTPNPTGTGAGASWDLAMAQLTAVKKILSGEQMLLTQWTNTSTMPKLALGIYLQHLGAIYVVDSADYTIPTPSSDGTWYVKLTVSGETLTVSVVNSLSGFAWSSQHNGLYNASNEQILPYQIVRGSSGTTYEKRKILNLANATNAFTTINYLGKVYGSELAVTGALSVGGALSASGVATFSNNIIDKNGREVLAMKMETQQLTGSGSISSAVSNYIFAKTFTFSSAVQGIVFTELSLFAANYTPYNRATMLESISISGSSVTIQYRGDLATATFTYVITCTAAVS